MTRRIYICGPMRGYPENNVPAFNRAADRFRALGWEVENPVDISTRVVEQLGADVPPGEYLRHDVRAIATCDALALLSGWEHSTGARCEVALAVTIGLAFYDAGSATKSRAPECVVIRGGYERPPGPADTLDTLRVEVIAWQHETFVHRTARSIATHLEREAIELRREVQVQSTPWCEGNPRAEQPLEGEIADVQLLLWGLADEVGVDLVAAVRAKLERNKRRTWGPPDADGVVEHTAEGAA